MSGISEDAAERAVAMEDCACETAADTTGDEEVQKVLPSSAQRASTPTRSFAMSVLMVSRCQWR